MVIFGFKYYKTTQVPTEAEIKKCKNEVVQMSDDQLINEMGNLKNLEDDSGVASKKTGEKQSRARLFKKTMTEFFICKTQPHIIEEGAYKRAKDYIINETQNSEDYLNWLELLSDGLYFNFTDILALADFNKVCPDELPGLCLKALEKLGTENQTVLSDCNTLCSIEKSLFEKQEDVKERILSLEDRTNSLEEYRGRYRVEIAFAFRFDRKDLASFVCDNIKLSEKDNCLRYIERFSYWQNCNLFKDDLSDLICAY